MATPDVNHALDGETKVPEIIAILSVCCALTSVIVTLRFITRKTIVGVIGADDWVILASQIGAIGSAVTIGLESAYGLGRHGWAVPGYDVVPYLKSFYSSILVYNAALVLAKISIVVQIRRIFTGPRMKRATLIALLILCAWGIALVTSLSMLCLPITKLWYPDSDGYCMPFLPAFFAPAVINMITDFGILILPLPAIKSLKLPMRQKIMLFCIFSLGFLTCVISIVRLSTLEAAATTTDPTWDNTEAALWSYLELTIAILAASLPTLRPLLLKFVPKFMGGSAASEVSRDTHSTSKHGRKAGSSVASEDIPITQFGRNGSSNSHDTMDDVELGIGSHPRQSSNSGGYSKTLIMSGNCDCALRAEMTRNKPANGISAVTTIKQEVRKL